MKTVSKLKLISNTAKKRREDFITKFKPIINNHKNDLPLINVSNNYTDVHVDSWFTISKQTNINNCSPSFVKENLEELELDEELDDSTLHCMQVKMLLTKEQKIIINKWMEAHTNMYNTGVAYIKYNNSFTKNEILKKTLTNTKFYNFRKLRDILKNEKDVIKMKSQLESFSKDTRIHTHTLDYALKQLCSNIKSAVTNLKRGHIKKFRLKHWKHNRPSKTIDIETQYIKNNCICPKVLGDIKYLYNKEPYLLNNINHNVKINYNSILDEYTLLIPIDNEELIIDNRNKLISLDPGLRTFMTGLSETGIVKIGGNVNKIIKKSIIRLNKIKYNKLIPNKIKKKNEILINRKISNRVNDLHWKTINYLVNNYDTILLGDMSAKSIVSKNNLILDPNSKTACLRTKYYEFRQRLEYKCRVVKTNYRLMNEYYTSKTCSNCGYYKVGLKGEENYECKKCKINIDRDVNGCRNIYFKQFI